ncbi:hypothetical protein SELMODRAFT_123038 [Selaginella moellendorffii]|uniref:L-ascorbate oxidase n=1 Tax=Selaginella moellendorffii TaxID=88036 RepID=D8SRL2_SELML|nr:L-ascorbate oxidase [Selaginella moellendorffii]EFJ12951.1 hypothetical protein SELMODRAFT_123038 [Selaginella moellendorffii]|eukprot:XP_002985774.1 L-ascorbate oxidase [Selaginella moellendorffii]
MEKIAALVLATAVVIAWIAPAARGEVRSFQWKVEYIYWAPDCVETVVIGINGQYPGPTIRATAGDTIRVELENGMSTEGLAIHWHGIRQIGTPFYDGVPFASQCPINPGETFTYEFVVDRPGTYFYHGHYGLQRSAGLYGSLIVDPVPSDAVPFTYDGELSIVLNDWWHRSIYSQETGLSQLGSAFRFVGEPQSLLIEGRGRYNCSLIPAAPSSPPLSGDVMSCNSSRPQCAMHALAVRPGLTYRLRIASVASLSSLNFLLEGHNMTLVEADGHYVTPVEISNLDIYSGETYSVLVTANQDPSRSYWAAVNVRGRRPATPTGLAILSYGDGSSSSAPPSTPAPQSPAWDDFAYSVAQARRVVSRPGFQIPLPERANVRLMLLSTQNRIDGKIKWAINNVSYVPRATPVIAAFQFNLTTAYDLAASPPRDFSRGYKIRNAPPNPSAIQGSGVYTFRHNDVVDVVLQNSNTLVPNNSEIHPWHLHGHDFWVLGYGSGIYRSHRHGSTLNFVNPPMRNTVAVFPYGWTYLRFRADNPGVWAFHCHIESHFHMGMGVMFAEGVDRLPRIPAQALGCGYTKALFTAP